MRVVCAPDSFKDSMSAVAAAEAMRAGVLRAAPDAEVDLCPVSDGGEGFVAAMRTAVGGRDVTTTVTGPRGGEVDAGWALLDDGTAVIEMAAASGLELLPRAQRDPTRTTTYGTGELIRAALQHDARRILVGIGGSATCDGGAGMAQALGVRFVDADGKTLTRPVTGGDLARIARVEFDAVEARLATTQILVACDVTNPLTGPNGAAHVYAPQKGATPQQVEQLDAGLTRLANVAGNDAALSAELPGAGAAGGLGYGLVVFAGAKLERGIEMVLDAVRFGERVRGAALCLTGEGKLDGQSLSGKAVLGVAQRAKAAGVATVALVGCVEGDVRRVLAAGLAGCEPIGAGVSVAESMRRGPELLAGAAQRVVGAMLRE